MPKRAVVNDLNTELIETYLTVKNNVEGLIAELKSFSNNSDFFYELRAWDRDNTIKQASAEQRAARMIFLNKTGFNGLYRVNGSGHFNVPYGKNKNANFVNEAVLRAVSEYLNSADIKFLNGDYGKVLDWVTEGDFVYLDPPYDPVSQTAKFTSYTTGGFGKNEQITLREFCDTLDERGIKFLLSNSATDFIKEQYAKYEIDIVPAKRAVNSIASGRGNVDEVLVRNYGFK